MSVRDELLKLYERDGFLVADQVVAEASDATSPLHTQFEWDDETAAIAHRLDQARKLIARCRILVQETPEQSFTVRAFVHVPKDGETAASYVPTQDALADDRQRDLVVAQAMRDLSALRRKYQSLIDFDQLLRQAATTPVAESDTVADAA